MSDRHCAPSTYRDLAREIAQKVDELSIERIKRNRRIAELEQERDEAREVANEAFAAVTEARAEVADTRAALARLRGYEAALREARALALNGDGGQVEGLLERLDAIESVTRAALGGGAT